MDVENLSIGLAFMAGLVSFISPCVLPLVPAYLGYMGGRASTEAEKSSRHQFSTFLHGIFFVLGFSIFFVGFGLLTAAASSFLERLGVDIPTVLTRLGGVAVIFFGLYVMKALDPIFRRLLKATAHDSNSPLAIGLTAAFVGVLLLYFYWVFGANGFPSIAWTIILFLAIAALFRNAMNQASSLTNFWQRAVTSLQIALISDTRKQISMQQGQQGYFGSLGIGLVFAAGWTPCIGPVYGAVLGLANDAAQGEGSLFSAAILLAAYSLGLGIPFLLTALAFNQSVSLMGRLKRNMLMIERVSGALLLVIGVLILSGGMTNFSKAIAADGELADFSYRLEECTAGVFGQRIAASSYPHCVQKGYPKLTDRYIAAVPKDNALQQADFTFDTIENLDAISVGLEVGQRAPDFTLISLDGSELALSDLRGQAVLINFWATWCGPCRAELPEFEAVFQAVKERGFTIVAVDYQEDAQQVRDFVNELQLSFNIVLDEGKVADLYRVKSYPNNFIVDGNGIISYINRGPIDAEILLEELSKFDPSHSSDTAALGLIG